MKNNWLSLIFDLRKALRLLESESSSGDAAHASGHGSPLGRLVQNLDRADALRQASPQKTAVERRGWNAVEQARQSREVTI